MSDPIERMNHLKNDVDGGPMMSAAEVRRRGDQIRRRRTVAVTTAVAAAVVAIAVPIAVATGNGTDNGGIDPAGPPTTTTPADPTTTTLAEANLLTEDDTEFDGQARWRQGETTTSESEHASDPCLGSPLGELGADAVFERTWGLEAHGLSQVVAEFASAAEARDAYADITEPRVDCKPFGARPSGDDGYLSGNGTPTTVPRADEAMVWDATFTLSGEEGGEAFADHRAIMGVAVAGDRLTVLHHDMPDGDYTDSWGDTSPVERMLPAAVERLVVDEPPSEPDATSAPEPGGTDWRTDIPAGFPVDRELSAPEGDPISGPGPDATGINPLDICPEPRGVLDARWTREPVERLAASAPGPEYLDARELVTFPDESEARGLLADIEFLVDDCAESGDGQVWTLHEAPELGEESLALSRTYDAGLGGDVYVFARVGNAVLAVDAMGEWELSSTVPAGISEVTDTAATIVPDMCRYAADGC